MEIPVNDTVLNLATYRTWMGNDGIARTKVKPFANITFKEARENSEVINAFYAGKKFPLLVDSRDIRSITKEARDFFSIQKRETAVNALAILIYSPLSKIIGNFFMDLNKPQVPAKLFTNELEALNWLKQYL